MLRSTSRCVWKQLDGLIRFGAAGPISDEELLGRFVARRGEDSEAAFAALVERYGPMVLGVCRRVLGDRHEAEDAFQAAFLVLARKAASIARREQLANWLFGVAWRTALDARARATRRQARERRLHAMTGPRSPSRPAGDEDPARDELRAILDEELARLPERYRGAVILCELESLSRRAAAQRLGIPEGTLSSRLARAKELLRRRLSRRGLALSAVVLDGALTREAAARTLVVPFSLTDSTIQAAARVAAGVSLAEAASTSVATLTQGVLQAMLLAKFKGIALGIAAAAMTTSVVLAQYGGVATAEGDRLGALERKLDRVLEALSLSDQPVYRVTIPKVAQAAPAKVTSPSADSSSRAASATRTTSAAYPGSDVAPATRATTTIPSDPTWPADKARVKARYEPADSSPPLGPRVDALEHRLADLERRLHAMEQRLTQPHPAPASTSSADGHDRSVASTIGRDPFDSDAPSGPVSTLKTPARTLPAQNR